MPWHLTRENDLSLFSDKKLIWSTDENDDLTSMTKAAVEHFQWERTSVRCNQRISCNAGPLTRSKRQHETFFGQSFDFDDVLSRMRRKHWRGPTRRKEWTLFNKPHGDLIAFNYHQSSTQRTRRSFYKDKLCFRVRRDGRLVQWRGEITFTLLFFRFVRERIALSPSL